MIKIFSFTVLTAFVFSGIQAASLADFTEIGLGGKCSLSSKVRCDSSTVCQNGICIYRSTVVSRSVHCDQLLSVRGYHGPVLSVGNYCFAENKCDGLYHALTVDVDLLKADSLCEQYGNYCVKKDDFSAQQQQQQEAPKPSGSTKGHGLITHLLDCGLGDCDKQDEANMEEQSNSTKGHSLLSHLLDCGSDECVKQDAASMEEESPKQQEEETSNPPGSTKGHGLLTHLLDCDSECDKQDATSTEKESLKQQEKASEQQQQQQETSNPSGPTKEHDLLSHLLDCDSNDCITQDVADLKGDLLDCHSDN